MNNKDVSFTPEEFEKVSKYLVGSFVRPFPNGKALIPQTNGLAREQPIEEKRMQAVMESCPFKGVMSFVVGGALGAFLGLFSSSIAPHHTTTPHGTTRHTAPQRCAARHNTTQQHNLTQLATP